MEAKTQPSSIKQWYQRATALDHNYKKSRREEERLRGKRDINGAPAPRLNQQRVLGQVLPRPHVWPRRQELPQQ